MPITQSPPVTTQQRRKPRLSSSFSCVERPILEDETRENAKTDLLPPSTPPSSPTIVTSFQPQPARQRSQSFANALDRSIFRAAAHPIFKSSPDPFVDITRLRMSSRSQYALFPGSTFSGTQRSGRQSYAVQVTIVDVNFDTSSLCGYLRIKGLTDEWPELTTYFDAEIIGEQYGFLTNNWGATEADDLTHWSRFPAFRNIRNDVKRPGLTISNKDRDKRGAVFMRWKERFLVPDHRVKDITGASFAGFYYVCVDFNPPQDTSNRNAHPRPQSTSSSGNLPHTTDSNSSLPFSGANRTTAGTAVMKGFYYHKHSEPYQQLDLVHTPESTSGTFEFH